MKSALLKDAAREVKHTLNRFLSIFAIAAIGVALFAGVKAAAPDMKVTADKYFDDYNLMDIRLLSTMGFNDKDIEAIKSVDGIEGIFPTYSMDAIVNIKDKDYVFNVLALSMDRVRRCDESYINRVKLVKGRFPQKPDECLVENRKMFNLRDNSNFGIGSKIKLSSGTDKGIDESLNVSEFTIAGIVETPYFISFERGTSSIGSGKVESFIMIPEENFKLSVYTDVFLTIKGAREILSFNESYDKLIKPIKVSLENIGKERAKGRYDEIVSEARGKIDESKKELQEAQEKQKTELSKALKKIEDGKRKIEDGEKKLKYKEDETYRLIKQGEDKINNGYKELQRGEEEYASNLKLFNEGKAQGEKEFEAAELQIKNGEEELIKSQAQIDQLKLMLTMPEISEQQKAVIKIQIEEGERKIAEGRAQLEASKAQLIEKKKEFADAEEELKNARVKLDASKAQFDSEKKKLEDSKKKAQAEFASARLNIEKSKADIKKGEEEYEKAKKESDEKIQEGYSKIADAEKELSKVKEPVWYVLDRNMHRDFVDYEKAADRIDAIAEVFPAFFFLVAALVCLTTMTRMVDEQRIYIGTLKALGYSKLSIALKYLIYAASASIGGSILGVLVGFKVFPTVIFNAYRIIYTLPSVITEFNWFYAVLSTILAVFSTVFAAYFACYKELSEAPAVLMRPKAPKAGRRIFLEEVTYLWRNLNFIQKVTARNLFRYKKRFLMTVFGIGGCTALLLSGFGLKDSIISIVSKQFDELYRYDMSVELKKDIDIQSLIDDISKDGRISDYMLYAHQNVDVGAGQDERTVSLFVPENAEKLNDFIILRVRTNGKIVPITSDGVVITEKLSKMIGVKIGDEIYIRNGDDKKVAAEVTGIAENYVSHYVYMSPEVYEALYGEKIKFNRLIAKTTDTSRPFEDKLAGELLKRDDISSVIFTTGISSSYKDMIKSLDYVVLVLIISAGILAFVVLYNLTSINITERLREIATIKVLGFYDSEVSSYVYRENIILTIIGMIFGFGLGILLHRYIVVTAEIDLVMFGRDIKPLSYVYSGIFTLLFSALVNFVMYFRLKKIDMVESLKSVD